jgi:hypothetical protein
MKANLKSLSLALLASGAMAAGSAYALDSVTSKFVPGQNTWSDDSAEFLVDHVGGTAGVLDKGDYLVGMIKITSFPTSPNPNPNTAKEFTAIYVTELLADPVALGTGIPCGGAVLASCSTLSFGAATAGFNAVWTALGFAPFTNSDGSPLDMNAAVVVLEGGVHDFARETAGGVLPALNTAINGANVVMVLGLTSAGDHWTGVAPTNLAETLLRTPGAGVGGFDLDLTILNESFAGWDFDPDVVGSGTVQRPTLGSAFSGAGFYDDTTVSLRLYRVPEPATLGLLGLGLLGLGLSRRKA